MKTHTRKLLTIIPLLPLLMANSPAPREQEYTDLEVTYLSEESLHGYNFYHFNLKNTGTGFLNSVNFTSEKSEKYFYADTYNSDIWEPFNNCYFEPGFDREIVVATRNTIPASKKVVASSYSRGVLAEEITYGGSMHVSYSLSRSDVSNDIYYYTIQAEKGGKAENYYYYTAAYVTYKGINYCIDVDDLTFTTNEKLDLEQFTLNKIVAIKNEYIRRNSDSWDYAGFLQSLLLFLLIFFVLLSFGIFSAIFFPAMARRRRRRALLANQEKDNEK